MVQKYKNRSSNMNVIVENKAAHFMARGIGKQHHIEKKFIVEGESF